MAPLLGHRPPKGLATNRLRMASRRVVNTVQTAVGYWLQYGRSVRNSRRPPDIPIVATSHRAEQPSLSVNDADAYIVH